MSEDAFPARLWAMADLFTPMALRVAATLGLADHVAAGVDSIPALAERTDADPDALSRLVAHLVSVGVLERNGADRLSLTELGEQLRGGRAWLDIAGALGRGDLAAFHLLDVVRTGRPAYPLTYGRGFWDDLAHDAALSESLDALMGSRLRSEAPEIADGYDWRALEHIVDVGGGNGTLLAAILAANPGLRGTLVELVGPAAAARRVLADAGVADRCEVVEGSFFEVLPAGADAYLLSGVLHNWDDEHAIALLRRCAEAAGATGRVLVIDHLDGAGGAASTEMDLRMLAYMGGRERSLRDFEQLAARAELDVGTVRTVTRHRSVLELRAARAL